VGKEYNPQFVDYIVTKMLRDSESFEKMKIWDFIWDYFSQDFKDVKVIIAQKKLEAEAFNK